VTAPAQLDPETAYQRFLPAAQALAADDVVAYYLDPDRVLATIRTAMQIFVAYKNQIPRHLPRIERPGLESLPALGLALRWSVEEAEKVAPNEQILRHTVAEARQLRGMILPIVAALAENRLVPQEHYDYSARTSKPRDVAAECVALSSIFKTYADALRNKHAADANIIQRAATVGTWLLENLRAPPVPTPDTKRTPPPPPPEPRSPPPPAVDLRDRFETLMMERYSNLRMVARYFCGEDYERFAPPLLR
jgi:hypothetical protein